MNEYSNVSGEERVRRIGELLSKGVTLMVAAEEAAGLGPKVTQARARSSQAVDEIAVGIVNYLEKVGVASPDEIMECLFLHRTTCFRYLRSLRGMGLVESMGYGADVQYKRTAKAQGLS